jgi:hypothetical protein
VIAPRVAMSTSGFRLFTDLLMTAGHFSVDPFQTSERRSRATEVLDGEKL